MWTWIKSLVGELQRLPIAQDDLPRLVRRVRAGVAPSAAWLPLPVVRRSAAAMRQTQERLDPVFPQTQPATARELDRPQRARRKSRK